VERDPEGKGCFASGVESQILSAYVDGQIPSAEAERIETHLSACANCRQEAENLRALKSVMKSLPRKTMPSSVIALLEEKAYAKPARGFLERIFALPKVWVPAAAFALGVLALALFIARGASDSAEGVPVQALLAAHYRYADEGSVPSADLSAGSFSAKLASYQEPVE